MPRLTSLRLEASTECDTYALGYFKLLSRISELEHLHTLHLHGFRDLGGHQQDLTAALSTLHRLHALVGFLARALTQLKGDTAGMRGTCGLFACHIQLLDSGITAALLSYWHTANLCVLQGLVSCGLEHSPANCSLTRLTHLSLRSNNLSALADALPAGCTYALQMLDVSDNQLGTPPDTRCSGWTAANLEAFAACNWSSLRVLGIRPGAPAGPRALEATAQTLEQLLMQGGVAQQLQLISIVHRRREQLPMADQMGVIA